MLKEKFQLALTLQAIAIDFFVFTALKIPFVRIAIYGLVYSMVDRKYRAMLLLSAILPVIILWGRSFPEFVGIFITTGESAIALNGSSIGIIDIPIIGKVDLGNLTMHFNQTTLPLYRKVIYSFPWMYWVVGVLTVSIGTMHIEAFVVNWVIKPEKRLIGAGFSGIFDFKERRKSLLTNVAIIVVVGIAIMFVFLRIWTFYIIGR